jgi:HK97 family phage major capsid protein
MRSIEELKARLVELHEVGNAIQAKADAEKRDLSVDEVKELDAVSEEFESVEADIARRQRINAQAERMGESAGRQVPPAPIANQAPSATPPARAGMRNSTLPTHEERQRWGFRNFGEFCVTVKNAVANPSAVDARLLTNAAASTYGSEGAGADGGFAVPPEWRAQIMELVSGEDSILAMTDQQQCSGNTITFPIDETTAWQTTGGIQAYWDSEAAAMAQSKPQLKDLTAKLSRITALVPVTDELLEDSTALDGYIGKKAGEKIDFKITDAIINGTGVGMPLGILNAPCLVTVNKESSQSTSTSTFHADNVAKMMARLPSKSFGRSVWFVNQDVIPFILKLGFTVNPAGSATPVGSGALYIPPGGLQNGTPYGTILGRPIVVTEACAAAGTVGDVILADMSKYLSVTKAGGVKSDVSMHLWFDQNLTAFRFVLRMNGQPWLSTTIARKNGSNVLSHFVALQTR